MTLYNSATPANIDDILTSTLVNRMNQGEVKDQFFNNHPVLYWMMRKAKKTVNGGERIIVDLQYEENQTADHYNEYETIDTTPTETLTEAVYDPVIASASITISLKDEAKNQAGSHRIIDLLEHRRKNAVRTLEKVMSDALFNESPGSKLPWTLSEIVSTSDPAAARGNLGNIDRDTYDWWNAQSIASGSFASAGVSTMNRLRRLCSSSAGSEEPDLVIFGETSYGYFENSLDPKIRYTDLEMAQAKFRTLKHGNATAVWDKSAPNDTIYMLNSECIHIAPYKGFEAKVLPFVKPTNKLSRTSQVVWIYNYVASAPRRLGTMTGVTA